MVGVVARLPKPVALLGPGGPLEVLAAMLLGDRQRLLGLLLHARVGAVELENSVGASR